MEKSVMVIGIDDSEHSQYALQWTIQHFIATENPSFKLVIVYAKPSAVTVLSGLTGPAVAEVLTYVESDLKKIAARVTEKAKQLCTANADVTVEIKEGDARNVLCEAVEKHNAAVLVVGSHGYGAIKRAVLGSVSDYCAYHAPCSVMIVKKPKH